jgi:hypothetical protein
MLNIGGGKALTYSGGFIIKMTLTTGVAYSSETCESYTLNFGTNDDKNSASTNPTIVTGSS